MDLNLRLSGFTSPAIPLAHAPVNRQSFASVDAGRGIAALLVVFFHANKLIINPAYWGTNVFGGILACGHAGVEFFFVLSGFLIAHAHASDIGRPERLGRYLSKRFNRIYPLYWLILSLMTAVALLRPEFASLRHVDLESIVASYLLVGRDSHAGVLTVSWTLFHESLFYAAFALAIIDRRAGIILGATWLTLIAAAAVAGLPALPAYVVSPINLLFAAGAVAQVAVRRNIVRNPLVWAMLGAAAFIALGAEEVAHPVLLEAERNLLYGIASAVALAGIASHERDRPLAVPRVLLALGASSYSLYLVHFPALSAVAIVMHRIGLMRRLPATLGVILLVAVVVAFGSLTHFVLERPLIRYLRTRNKDCLNVPLLSGTRI